MKLKFILSTILIIALPVSATAYLSNQYKVEQIKQLNTIATKTIVDNTSINYTPSNYDLEDTNRLINENESLDTSSYNIQYKSISGSDFTKEKINSETYINLNCNVNFSYSINGKSFNSDIETTLLFKKENDKYELKSTDDLIQDTFSKISLTSSDSNLDLLIENNLIYDNDIFNIQFNYPDSLNYVVASGKSEEDGKYETITFTDNNLSNKEYIKVYIQEKAISEDFVPSKLLDNGYKVITNESIFKNNSFTIIENNFTNDGYIEKEKIFILNNPIGNVQYLTVTTNKENDPNLKTILETIKSST